MENKTTAVKSAPAKKPAPAATQKESGGSFFATIVIVLSIVAAILIFKFVLGTPSNFINNDPENLPLNGNILGTVYKGGVIVPVLMSLLIMVLTFSIERFLTLSKAKGNKSISEFVRTVRQRLAANDVSGAIAACDAQKGSVANVVKAGLRKYQEMEMERGMDKDQKVAAIQKEIEEATTLELPMLEKNLVIISTIASIATLVGLLGTVFGMIRAFSALANAGAPDAVALSTGISEALINTALGIGGSAVAIVAYNFFTSKIDELTYSIDEAGFSIAQTFAAQHGAAESPRTTTSYGA